MSSPRTTTRIVAAILGLVMLGGCGSVGFHQVRPTTLALAGADVPESRLLDVGVAMSAVPELSESQLEKQGTHADIRAAESTFVPYHLKSTLERSSYWGAVRVIPPEDDSADLKITSELISSNGEMMQLAVTAVDASGGPWLERKYQAKVSATAYVNTAPGEREAFQDLYNTIANDLAAFQRGLVPSDIEQIRTISKLRFAAEFAPDAFGDYLGTGDDGRLAIEHLPAEDDPLMDRIDRIRERDGMFLDTLNLYYEGFYHDMWEAYQNWRQFSLAEQVALREMKTRGFFQALTGILMIAAAVALESQAFTGADTAQGVLILVGGQVVIGGINVSQQAEIHAAAIEELSASFASEMRPTVIELEGKQYELTGTADEQYDRWKELLHRIYLEETGFGTADMPSASTPADQ